MSGYNRHGNRSSAGKSADGRMKNNNGGSLTEWKPKPKVSADESSNIVSDKSPTISESASEKNPIFSPNPSLDINLQQKTLDLNPVIENLKLKSSENDSKHLESVDHSSKSLQVDRISKNGKQIEEKIQEKDDGGGRTEEIDCITPIKRFDICQKKVSSVVKLNAPLHAINREKRNQIKRSVEGNNIMILRPGMVLMKGYLSSDEQIKIVKTCRDLGIKDGGFYQPGYNSGSKLNLKMMCLGKNWDPQTGEYTEIRSIDNSKPPKIPDLFQEMVKKAIQDSNTYIQKTNSKADSGKIIPPMSPDICIVNFYSKNGKLGLHQDKDESAESINEGLPVVSFSIGDSAEFLYGEIRDIEKAEKVILESGDVLIFGGKSRRIFHGVSLIKPGTTPESVVVATDMIPGRLNLTFRKY